MKGERYDDIARLQEPASSPRSEFPELWEAYETLGAAAGKSGPLDGRTRRLIKLALSIGADSEGAVHSHSRQAMEEGLAPGELR